MLNSQDLDSLYPFAAIRCQRIVRTTEKLIGDMQLSSKTALDLGANNVGVLAGRCRRASELIDKFRELATSPFPGQIVVALSTNQLAEEYFRAFQSEGIGRSRKGFCTFGCVTFTTPEKLKLLGMQQLGGRRVAAVCLVDPPCIVYRARGDLKSGYVRNDRPQHLARFRAAHEIDGWKPPFLLLTEQPTMSLNTNQMLMPYSLENWWYVDGSQIRMGTPPTISSSDSDDAPDASNLSQEEACTSS